MALTHLTKIVLILFCVSLGCKSSETLHFTKSSTPNTPEQEAKLDKAADNFATIAQHLKPYIHRYTLNGSEESLGLLDQATSITPAQMRSFVRSDAFDTLMKEAALAEVKDGLELVTSPTDTAPSNPQEFYKKIKSFIGSDDPKNALYLMMGMAVLSIVKDRALFSLERLPKNRRELLGAIAWNFVVLAYGGAALSCTEECSKETKKNLDNVGSLVFLGDGIVGIMSARLMFKKSFTSAFPVADAAHSKTKGSGLKMVGMTAGYALMGAVFGALAMKSLFEAGRKAKDKLLLAENSPDPTSNDYVTPVILLIALGNQAKEIAEMKAQNH